MTDDRATDERQRYTSRLQRQAMAHVTAEISTAGDDDAVDRQIAMMIQHARAITGARRVTLLRPIPRSNRWHTVSLVEHGGFYHGLAAPDGLVLPMIVVDQKTPLLLGPNRPHHIPTPRIEDLGIRSYLGLPLIAGEVVVVLEIVDVAQSDRLDGYVERLTRDMEPLIDILRDDVTIPAGFRPDGSLGVEIDDETVLDLVLRPPAGEDGAIEVPGAAWPLLVWFDGQRGLAEAATAAGLGTDSARDIAADFLQRGLARVGPESRRRG